MIDLQTLYGIRSRKSVITFTSWSMFFVTNEALVSSSKAASNCSLVQPTTTCENYLLLNKLVPRLLIFPQLIHHTLSLYRDYDFMFFTIG
jgi:hypothetical protein